MCLLIIFRLIIIMEFGLDIVNTLEILVNMKILIPIVVYNIF